MSPFQRWDENASKLTIQVISSSQKKFLCSFFVIKIEQLQINYGFSTINNKAEPFH